MHGGSLERDRGCHSDELEEGCLCLSGTGHQTGCRPAGALMKVGRCADMLQRDLGISGPLCSRSLGLAHGADFLQALHIMEMSAQLLQHPIPNS